MEETRPCSFRPVLLNKLCCLVWPYPKLPDNHILSAGSHLSQYRTAFIRSVLIKRAQKRFSQDYAFKKQQVESLDFLLAFPPAIFKTFVRLPVIKNLILARAARKLQEFTRQISRRTPQKLLPDTALLEDSFKIFFPPGHNRKLTDYNKALLPGQFTWPDFCPAPWRQSLPLLHAALRHSAQSAWRRSRGPACSNAYSSHSRTSQPGAPVT